jgi:hypothetical protein
LTNPNTTWRGVRRWLLKNSNQNESIELAANELLRDARNGRATLVRTESAIFDSVQRKKQQQVPEIKSGITLHGARLKIRSDF